MGPKPRIPLEDRGKVVALSEEGYSQREIAARVGCSQRSVSGILKKHEETGSVRDKRIPGRLRKTTSREDSILVRKSKADRFKTAPQLKAEMNLEYGVQVSTSTAQRRLREAGLFGRKPRRKPRLTPAHKRARLDFAREHKDWTMSQWEKVIFSDESRFLLHRSDGRVYVRRMLGEEFKETCVQTTVKHGGGGIMVWGCMTAKGVGFLTKVEGRLNGEAYIDLLGDSLIPSVHLHGMTGNFIFQQDNATCHTSRPVREWFEEEGIEVMTWPAQSPDLNPIENLWDFIGKGVEQQNPTSIAGIWTAVNNTWEAIPLERLKTLYESMPRRCEAVIKAKGGPTRY